MRRWWCVMVLMLAGAGRGEAQDFFNQVQTVTLANGMTVLLAPDARSTAVDVAVWYRSGARYERAATSGVSALVGRLMYRGSRRHPDGEHRRLLEGVAARINQVTNPDYTCFYQTVPPEALPLALDLEADRMEGLMITAAKLTAERRAAADEARARFADDPIAQGLQQLYALVFQGHPYGRAPGGAGQSLARITLPQVQAYYRSRFSPRNAVLTIAGRFDAVPTLASVRKNFEGLPSPPSPVEPAVAIAPQRLERRANRGARVGSPIVMAGWRGPGRSDPDAPALELLARILGGGPLSRLNRALTGSGKSILQAQSDLDASKEASLLFVIAAVRPNADLAAAERSLVEETEKLATEPVAAEELDRAKRQIEGEILFGWETAHGRAQSLGTAQIVAGDYRAAHDRLDRLRQLTPADLQHAAARIFKESTRSVVRVTPEVAANTSRPSARKGGSR